MRTMNTYSSTLRVTRGGSVRALGGIAMREA
jgi:hypothetical protein